MDFIEHPVTKESQWTSQRINMGFKGRVPIKLTPRFVTLEQEDVQVIAMTENYAKLKNRYPNPCHTYVCLFPFNGVRRHDDIGK